MFIPEYTITPKTLKNISNIEYAKAIIEIAAILPHWEKQLQKEARLRIITASLQMEKKFVDKTKVKALIDGMLKENLPYATNFNSTFDHLNQSLLELDENFLKDLYSHLTQLPGTYRSKKLNTHANPEEILALIVEFFDWFNSLDAKDTHPAIIAAILKAWIEKISPFEENNFSVSGLSTYAFLKTQGYSLNQYICLEDYFKNTQTEYSQLLSGIDQYVPEFTHWIEYFTEGLARETLNIKEKVSLLARDTKIAKASGRVKLTQRQERIIEYLQDYGLLQNKDFPRVFPGISEDSILRDLKHLMTREIIIKTGSTKSSRYELK